MKEKVLHQDKINVDTFSQKCATQVLPKETTSILGGRGSSSEYLFRIPKSLTALVHQDRIVLDLLQKDRYNPSFVAHMNTLAAHIQSIRNPTKMLPEQPQQEVFEPLTLKAYVAKEFRIRELEEEIAVKTQQILQGQEQVKQLTEELNFFKKPGKKKRQFNGPNQVQILPPTIDAAKTHIYIVIQKEEHRRLINLQELLQAIVEGLIPRPQGLNLMSHSLYGHLTQ